MFCFLFCFVLFLLLFGISRNVLKKNESFEGSCWWNFIHAMNMNCNAIWSINFFERKKSVLISLISDMSPIWGLNIKRIFGRRSWKRGLLRSLHASTLHCSEVGKGATSSALSNETVSGYRAFCWEVVRFFPCRVGLPDLRSAAFLTTLASLAPPQRTVVERQPRGWAVSVV